MTKAERTAGPWRICRTRMGGETIAFHIVADQFGSANPICEYNGKNFASAEVEANAAAIAHWENNFDRITAERDLYKRQLEDAMKVLGETRSYVAIRRVNQPLRMTANKKSQEATLLDAIDSAIASIKQVKP